MNRTPQTDRRRFLKAAGATVALPIFESLLSRSAFAAAKDVIAPQRYAFVYFPNGCNVSQWRPESSGNDYQLSPSLEPLAELKEHFQVLTGFEHENATAGRDGGGDHARANATFLTGMRAKKTGGADIKLGISVDQVLANHIGHETFLPSLEVSCDSARNSGSCDSGYACAYQFNLSWRNATTPVSPEARPRLVFERMFGGGGGGDLLRREQKRSVLDFLADDARRLNRRMGNNDRKKMAEYLEGVRSVEQRIERAEKFAERNRPDMEVPEEIPEHYSDHIRLMYDMMVLAYQTDATRVASFLLAHDGSNRSFPEVGVDDGHHNLSHHGNNKDKLAKIAKIDKFYVEQFAYFLRKLKETTDANGESLLHNSTIIYGGGIEDPNRHRHNNLPIIMAGHGGGKLTTGRHLRLDHDVPLSNLYMNILQNAGIESQNFGDSNGVWTDI